MPSRPPRDSVRERKASGTMRGLALAGGLILALAGSAAAGGPGVRCATVRARSSIEALICRSPLLAALDAEMARLYHLATGPREPLVAVAAKQAQRDWLAERQRCAKSRARETCVRDRYLARIAGLRVASQAARSEDDRGISLGPFVFKCANTDGLLTAIFVNTDPALASVFHDGHRVTMERAPSGRGARYEGPEGQQLSEQLSEHQGEATYREGTAAPEVRCIRQSID
jgi:uncharacterized protein